MFVFFWKRLIIMYRFGRKFKFILAAFTKNDTVRVRRARTYENESPNNMCFSLVCGVEQSKQWPRRIDWWNENRFVEFVGEGSALQAHFAIICYRSVRNKLYCVVILVEDNSIVKGQWEFLWVRPREMNVTWSETCYWHRIYIIGKYYCT